MKPLNTGKVLTTLPLYNIVLENLAFKLQCMVNICLHSILVFMEIYQCVEYPEINISKVTRFHWKFNIFNNRILIYYTIFNFSGGMPVAMRVEYADVLFIPGSLTMSISI